MSAVHHEAAQLRVRVAQLEGELQQARQNVSAARDEAERARKAASDAWQFAKLLARTGRESSRGA